MAQFKVAFNITMGNEGGYANNPHDSGGETYAGIARNDWPHWAGWPLVDNVVSQHSLMQTDQSLRSNAALQAEVQAFYKAQFWDVIRLDQLNGQQLANQLFDTAVNMGVGTAARFLQEAIDTLSPGKVNIDGAVGPLTLAAANVLPEQTLYNALIGIRKERYLAIIANNPSQAQFEHSWLSRLTPFNTSTLT